MSDSWSSDEASPVQSRALRPPQPAISTAARDKIARESPVQKRAIARSTTAESAADDELRAAPPTATINADSAPGTVKSVGNDTQAASQPRSGASSSSDWDSSDTDDSKPAARNSPFKSIGGRIQSRAISGAQTSAVGGTDFTDASASAASRARRRMSDTAATSTCDAAAADSTQGDSSSSSMTAAVVVDTGREIASCSAVDRGASESVPTNDDVATVSPDLPVAAPLSVSVVISPSVAPPIAPQQPQFTRRAMVGSSLTPRDESAELIGSNIRRRPQNPPHASPRFNPSLTPRGDSITDSKARASMKSVSSSSSDESESRSSRPTTSTNTSSAMPIHHQRQNQNQHQPQQHHLQYIQQNHQDAQNSQFHQEDKSKPHSAPRHAQSTPESTPSILASPNSANLAGSPSNSHGKLRPSFSVVSESIPVPNVEPLDAGNGSIVVENQTHTRCSRLIVVPLAFGLTGTCLGLCLISLGVVCFSNKGSVCGPLGSSWGTVALIAFGIFMLLAFSGLLKSAFRIYRERWDFYKMQRYEQQQRQAERQGHNASSSQVPVDGMFFDSSQFFENMYRTQGGGRKLAPSEDFGNVANNDMSSSKEHNAFEMTAADDGASVAASPKPVKVAKKARAGETRV